MKTIAAKRLVVDRVAKAKILAFLNAIYPKK